LEKTRSYRANDLKQLNRINILKLLKGGTYSRAEISSVLGLSKPAVSSFAEQMISEGLIIEKGYGFSGEAGGKRPIMLELNTNAGLIIALDFNDRWYEIALMNLSSIEICYRKKNTTIHDDYRITFGEIIEEIQGMIDEVRSQGILLPVIACGISLKGLVNTQEGTLQYSAGIPQWKDISVGDFISKSLNIPTFVENDARALTLAEVLTQESDQPVMDVLACINVNLGIGTGVAIKNEIYRGAFDGAVTFSHTVVVDNGPLCKCGNYGCWETLASDIAFLRELAARNKEYAKLDCAGAIQKFNEGDPIVRDVLLNYTGYWLGVGISNMLNVFNPDFLIIQGEITSAGEELKSKIEEVAKNRALPVSGKAKILFSRISDRLHLKAASAIVIQQFFSKENHHLIWKAGECHYELES
jgi:N-acetylglucosamine repressor